MMKKYILLLAFFGATTYSYTNSGGSPAGKPVQVAIVTEVGVQVEQSL